MMPASGMTNAPMSAMIESVLVFWPAATGAVYGVAGGVAAAGGGVAGEHAAAPGRAPTIFRNEFVEFLVELVARLYRPVEVGSAKHLLPNLHARFECTLAHVCPWLPWLQMDGLSKIGNKFVISSWCG